MNTAGNKMRMEIISATGLYETGKIKKQDPYVEVHVGNEVARKTKPDKRAGSDPVWDEELDIDVHGTSAPSIKFVIKDKNLLVKDDIIGIATLDLSRGSRGAQSLPVFTPNGEPAGQLKIRLISGHERFGTTGKTAAGVGAAAAGAGAVGAAARHGTHGTATTGTGVGGMADRNIGTGTGVAGAGRPHGTAAAGAGVGGVGVAGAAGRAVERHEERRDERHLHEGQAAGVGAGLGAAHHGTHGTATSGLERDLENKAHIGTGPHTGTHHTGVMGAAERGVEAVAGRDVGGQHAGGAGTGRGVAGFTGDMTNLAGNRGTVCDQKFYTVEEDRPIVKEVKQYVREHHPVEREMVRETKTTGRERHMPTGPSELVNVEERVVDKTIPKPCP